MKIKYCIFVLITFVTLSCQKDEVVPLAIVNVADFKADARCTIANIFCSVSSISKQSKVSLQYSIDRDFAQYDSCEMFLNDTLYCGAMSPLHPGCTYFLRYFVYNNFGSLYSSRIDSINTQVYKQAIVKTDSVDNVSSTQATVWGSLHYLGSDTLPKVGFCYSTHSGVSTSDTNVPCSLDDESFHLTLNSLKEYTTYYIRAYAINNMGTSYGEEFHFKTTPSVKPTLSTSSVTNIQYTSATCGGNITNDGGFQVTSRGICYSTSMNPTTANKTVSSGTGRGTFTCNMTGLTAGTTYYVRAYATNSNGTSYGNQVSFKTPIIENAVDLGLPSGLLWAIYNVGASTPEEYGDYFAWGETTTKSQYDWTTYKTLSNGSNSSLKKYCTRSGFGVVDNKTTLEPEDDAAHVNWGGLWRMPTYAEQLELIEYCDVTMTTNYNRTGIAGAIFTSKKNGNFIFLPATGDYYNGYAHSVGTQGYYASSSLNEEMPYYACCLRINVISGNVSGSTCHQRCNGFSVRPVCK